MEGPGPEGAIETGAVEEKTLDSLLSSMFWGFGGGRGSVVRLGRCEGSGLSRGGWGYGVRGGEWKLGWTRGLCAREYVSSTRVGERKCG